MLDRSLATDFSSTTPAIPLRRRLRTANLSAPEPFRADCVLRGLLHAHKSPLRAQGQQFVVLDGDRIQTLSRTAPRTRETTIFPQNSTLSCALNRAWFSFIVVHPGPHGRSLRRLPCCTAGQLASCVARCPGRLAAALYVQSGSLPDSNLNYRTARQLAAPNLNCQRPGLAAPVYASPGPLLRSPNRRLCRTSRAGDGRRFHLSWRVGGHVSDSSSVPV